MANGGNKGAVVIIAILAVAGLGLSGYTFVSEQFLGGDDHTHPGNLRLVGLWDDLDENLTSNPLYNSASDWLVEFQDQKVLNEDYLDVVNNTRFHVLIPGFYKVNLNIILFGADDLSSSYWIQLMVNGSEAGYFMRLEIGITAPNPETTFHHVACSLYVNASSSEDFYEIRANGFNDFEIATDFGSPYFNQLSIEHVMD